MFNRRIECEVVRGGGGEGVEEGGFGGVLQ